MTAQIVEHEGITYPTIRAGCKALGHSDSTIRTRMRRDNCSFSEALKKKVRSKESYWKNKVRSNNPPHEHFGESHSLAMLMRKPFMEWAL